MDADKVKDGMEVYFNPYGKTGKVLATFQEDPEHEPVFQVEVDDETVNGVRALDLLEEAPA